MLRDRLWRAAGWAVSMIEREISPAHTPDLEEVTTELPGLVLLHCAGCSASIQVSPVETENFPNFWFYTRPPEKIQGLYIGICPACRGGSKFEEELEEEVCDGKHEYWTHNNLDHYYLVRMESNNMWWCCWDRECVTRWYDNNGDCPHCGQELSGSLYEVKNEQRRFLEDLW